MQNFRFKRQTFNPMTGKYKTESTSAKFFNITEANNWAKENGWALA